MYNHKTTRPSKSLFNLNNTVEGEYLHQKIRRIMSNKEAITDKAPLIYTDRKQGVIPDYDIRTDKMAEAAKIMDVANKSQLAKRQDRMGLNQDGTPKPSVEGKEINKPDNENQEGNSNEGNAGSNEGKA